MKKAFILALAISFCGLFSTCTQIETDPQGGAKGGTQTETSPAKLVYYTPTPAAETEASTEANSEPSSPTPTVKKDGIPKFEDYPVEETYDGKTSPLKMNSETSTFKTRFREAAKGTPNFGGRYILATWGCGTDCLMGGVIDAKTGETYMIPFSICCLYEKDAEAEKVAIRKDSRLINFNGLLNETESKVFRHYYLFENGKFVKISSKK